MAAAVCVVVVSWNGAHLLPQCLDALLAQEVPGRPLEIVVVDNGSTDGTPELLRARYPVVRLVALARNTGFAAGANAGIAASSAPFVVLVNNDAVCAPGFVAALLAPFEGPDAGRLGAVTARILLAGRYRRLADHEPADRELATGGLVGFDGHRWAPADATDPRGVELVNGTGNEVTRSGNGRDRDWLASADGSCPDAATAGVPGSASDVFGFCGGAAALSRAALDDVGGFDERLFLYYEDTDLSWRLRRRGWRVEYAAGAVAGHRHAASSGMRSELFLRHNERNRVAVAVRNAPLPVVVRAIAHLAGHAVRDALHGRGLRRHVCTAAYLTVNAPRLWRERRDIDSHATVPRREVARYLVPDP